MLPALIVLLAVTTLCSCSDDNDNDNSTTPSINTAPEISSISSTPASVGLGLDSSVTCLASDADGDGLTYTWTSSAGTIAGTGSTVTWTAPGAVGSCTVSCSVSDGEDSVDDSVIITVFEPVVPGTMVTVQGGTFVMGDSYDEGSAAERPTHTITLDDFLIGKYELTQAEWAEFMTAPTYDVGSGANYPVYSVSFFDVIVYCNYRSIDEGLTPCYTIAGSTMPSDWPAVPNFNNDSTVPTWNAVICNWTANGYRMPTEAEWEFAARGGATHSDNYRYSGGQNVEDVAWFGDNAAAGCQSVGTRMPNQLGVYDMSGNQYELCWDWYADNYYTTCNDLGTVANPTGPGSAEMRVVRGGAWGGAAENCRVAGRFRDYAVSRFSHTGVRLVRTP